MTRWDALQSQWAAWINYEEEYERAAEGIMLAFYRGLLGHCGLPEDSVHPGVYLMAVDPRLDGVEKYKECDHATKALSHDDDGWRFGLCLNLGQGLRNLRTFFDVTLTFNEQSGTVLLRDKTGEARGE